MDFLIFKMALMDFYIEKLKAISVISEKDVLCGGKWKSKQSANKFLEPTSNRIERFFSAAGYSLGDLRQSITPLHLEEQLFLKANARMWNVETVNDALQEENLETFQLNALNGHNGH